MHFPTQKHTHNAFFSISAFMGPIEVIVFKSHVSNMIKIIIAKDPNAENKNLALNSEP